MKLKQRLEDFRVRELLEPGHLGPSGPWRVYRVTKRKLTSLEAAAHLASEAGVPAGDVAMAGLKDRQGITTQYMALRNGRDVRLRSDDLSIESAGFSPDELSSEHSSGNAFEIVVRALDRDELAVLRANIPVVREQGVVNYFDEQRFGNLRHGQGWIALDLMRGEHERALRALLASYSTADDPRTRAFKTALTGAWGDWAECRDVAGRFGQHHSVFEYLKKRPDDFGGAFYHVATRVRLIHLYAFQSHLWNRAVAAAMRRFAPGEGQLAVLANEEGPLFYPAGRFAHAAELGASFRLPGPGLEDVKNPVHRELLEQVLAREKLAAADFRIEGVPGFQLKGEDRPLFVAPAHLRVRPAQPDAVNRGLSLVKVRFELPRGAYATLVVRRLFATAGGEVREHAERTPPAREHGERGGDRPRFERPARRGERDADRRDPRRDERSDRARGRDSAPRGERGSGRAPREGDARPPRGPRPQVDRPVRRGPSSGEGGAARGGAHGRGGRGDRGDRGGRPPRIR